MIYTGECLEVLARLDPGIVDFAFIDLPYEVTNNPWDVIIPFEPLWAQLNRVCKETAVLVFTAVQPFTSQVVHSNLKDFKYEVIWKKNRSTNPLNAKKQPLRVHESCLVFYKRSPEYVPQMSHGHKPVNKVKASSIPRRGNSYGTSRNVDAGGQTTRYPTTILEIPIVNGNDPERIHPSQKPVELVSWFLRTYAKPGYVVLDPVIGSGTTAVAAKQLGMHWIGIEQDPEMAEKARVRVMNA